jgi:hypothetical protein
MGANLYRSPEGGKGPGGKTEAETASPTYDALLPVKSKQD